MPQVKIQEPEHDWKAEKKKLEHLHQKRLSMIVTTAFMTLASIAVFGGLGWWIDKLTGKSLLFIILALVLSYPITQVALYRKAKSTYQKK